MKTKVTLSLAFMLITIIAVQFYIGSNGAMSNSSGAIAGRAGDPAGGNLNCTSCHSGPSASAQSGWITSNIPSAGYTPGATYTITATATAAGIVKFGFEISPQNASGTFLGTLINTSTATQLVGSNRYITHTSSGTTGTTGFHTWTFNWTAPASGSGPVTFYGAFNATNNNGNNSGDIIYTSQLTVSQAIQLSTTQTNVTCNGLCNGVANAVASGGAAPLSYLWSNGATTASITNICANTYTVTVTDAAAASQTTTVTITQPAPVVPTISISTALTTLCQGSNITFTATATNTGTTPTYQWKIDGNNAGTNATTFTTNALTPGQSVACVLTSNAACANPTSITSNTISPTVTPTVTPTISITTPSNTLCEGSIASFTATATNGGSSPSFNWFVDGISQAVNATNFTSTNIGTHTIAAQLVSNATCATLATANSNTLSVTITATATPTVQVLSGTTSICAGSNLAFTTNATNAGNNPIYEWYVDNTLINSVSGNSYATASLTNNQTVSAVLISNQACVNTNSVASNTVTVTVNPLVVSNFSYPSSTFCNLTGVVSCTVAAAGSFTAIPSGLVINTATGDIDIAASAVGTYTVTQSSNVACYVPSSQSISITANPIATFAYSSNAYCQNNIAALPQFANGASAGQFTAGAGLAINATTGAINFANSAAGTYTVTNFIPASGPCAAAAASTVIIIDELPTLTANNDAICAGQATTLLANASIQGGNYLWLPSNATTASNTVTPTATTTYTVSYTLGACTVGALSTVTVTSVATPTITVNGLLLTSSASSGNQWYWNGNLLNGETNSTLQATQNGNYTVIVTTNGCTSNASQVAAITSVGIVETITANSFSIYPNPVAEVAHITFAQAQQNAQLRVLDLLGNEVKRITITSATSEIVFEKNNLKPGVYFVELIDTQGKKSNNKMVIR